MKIKGVIKNLKKIFFNDNGKIYLGISLELLRAVWGQFSFTQFLVLAYTCSRGLQASSNVVNANYRVLISCTCHFQSSSLFFVYFGFLCLRVSSVSDFCPDTRGQRWSFIQAHLFSCAAGREEHCKQILLTCVGIAHSVWATLGFSHAHGMCDFRSALLRLQVALPGNCLKLALGYVHFPVLSCSGSSSQVVKGIDSAGAAFCALLRSEQLK